MSSSRGRAACPDVTPSPGGRCVRVSWRQVQPGMREYDPARGHPVITRVDLNRQDSWHRRAPLTLTTCDGTFGWSPMGGFVKILAEERLS